jgi:zinc/manganese transport system substrate-binding protein
LTIAIILLGLTASSPASAKLNVFACEPEWGALAAEIGGNNVSVYTATTGRGDPHRVQARPVLIARARNADISVCTGAELEIRWLPQIKRQTSNPKIQFGMVGEFEAARFVSLKEVPEVLDRVQGTIHLAGNPHVQTSPANMLPIAGALAERFSQLDPDNAQFYASRLREFTKRWQAALARWQVEAAPLRGVPIAVQHLGWLYLENWLDLKRVTALEPQPGVPPSAGHLTDVAHMLEKTPVRVVIRAAYEDPRPADFISRQAHIPTVTLPFTVGGTDTAKDLFSLYDETIGRLLAALGD